MINACDENRRFQRKLFDSCTRRVAVANFTGSVHNHLGKRRLLTMWSEVALCLPATI